MSDPADASDNLDADQPNESDTENADSESTLSAHSDSIPLADSPPIPIHPPLPLAAPPKQPPPPKTMASKPTVPFRMPEFKVQAPLAFFNLAEIGFKAYQITDETQKYMFLADSVPYDTLGETVLSMCNKTPDGDNPYKMLKDAILEYVTPGSWAQVKAKMRETKRGDMRPTHYLAKLRSFALPTMVNNNMYETELKEVFQASYLPDWANTLLVLKDIDEAAKCADVLFERDQQQKSFPYGASSLAAMSTEAHPAKNSSSSSHDQRLTRIEKSIESLVKGLSINQQQQQQRPSNNGQARQSRQPWRNKSKSREEETQQRSQPRSPSPSPLNKVVDGVCGYHAQHGQRSRNCVEGCAYHEAFLAYQAIFSAQPSSNSKGQQT
jgi:hypothetical protein